MQAPRHPHRRVAIQSCALARTRKKREPLRVRTTTNTAMRWMQAK